jgi:hypothetical protein
MLCLATILWLASAGHGLQAGDKQPDASPAVPHANASTAGEPLEKVLRDLALRFGFDISIKGAVQGESVTADVRDLTLDSALRGILKGYNYVLMWHEGSARQTLLIFGKSERSERVESLGAQSHGSSVAGLASSVRSALLAAPPPFVTHGTTVGPEPERVTPPVESAVDGPTKSVETVPFGQIAVGGPGGRRVSQSSVSTQTTEPVAQVSPIAGIEPPPTPPVASSRPVTRQSGTVPIDPGLLIPPQVPF